MKSEAKKHSQWLDVWKRFKRNKMAMVGACIVIFLILVAIFADVIAPYDYSVQDLSIRFMNPSREHWFGTDNLGRDILSRVIYGGRISLLVSVLSTIIALIVGTVLGAIAGYAGGKTETLIMRITDIFMAVPSILLAACISAMLGGGIWQTAVAVSITGAAQNVRIIRAEVMTIRDQEYIEAATMSGASNALIVMKHVIPNCMAPLIVQTTMSIGGAILAISGLSFIGLGVQPPIPEWGSMLNTGRQFIRDFWPLCVFPGVAIMITLYGFNVLGDGLRDALDPKLKQ